jgi:hypothetical protein
LGSAGAIIGVRTKTNEEAAFCEIAKSILNFAKVERWDLEGLGRLSEMKALMSGNEIRNVFEIGRFLREAYVKSLLGTHFIQLIEASTTHSIKIHCN